MRPVRTSQWNPFLSYALWVTLKHLLKRRAPIESKPTDGREIRLRRITEPTAEQKSLLQQLGLTLPDRFHSKRECSVDSAIA